MSNSRSLPGGWFGKKDPQSSKRWSPPGAALGSPFSFDTFFLSDTIHTHGFNHHPSHTVNKCPPCGTCSSGFGGHITDIHFQARHPGWQLHPWHLILDVSRQLSLSSPSNLVLMSHCLLWSLVKEPNLYFYTSQKHGDLQPPFSLWFLLLLLFSHSVVSNSFAAPWTVVCQAPLSMGFSGQEYWSGLSFPSPRDLPDPGIKPTSSVLGGGFFYHWPTRKANQKAK